MSTFKIVVSDLHLADGSPRFEGFGNRQQAAFEGLLQASSVRKDLLGRADAVELIINGDCFDFLVTQPYTTSSTTTPERALHQLEKIIATHPSFFVALRSFISVAGRTITFIAGNHDIELCFAALRQRICEAIVGTQSDERIYFCPTRFYRPLPDVYIEHGNHYDFWNHAQQGLWNEEGEPLTTDPATILFPVGTRYFQSASHQINERYPYFDHFEPPLESTRQIALLCLFAPELIVETAQRTMRLLSYHREALGDLQPGEEQDALLLFEVAIRDFAAFQEDMVAHKSDWSAPESMQVTQEDILEFMRVREALTLPREEAVRRICMPQGYKMAESVAQGMRSLLLRSQELGYAIAGHTHSSCTEKVHQGKQTYLNTGTWTSRFALPTAEKISPALLQWLQDPDWQQIPLQEVTQFVFALVTSYPGRPSHAKLYVWDSEQDNYHILA